MIPFAALTVRSSSMLAPPVESDSRESWDFESDDTVSELLQDLEFLNQPTGIRVATAVDGFAFVPSARMSASSLRGTRWRIARRGIVLEDAAIVVYLEEDASDAVQRNLYGGQIGFDVRVEEVSGPPLNDLIHSKNERLRSEIESLGQDTGLLNTLHLRYGLLPIEQARKISKESLEEAYRSIVILGFRMSPSQLPLVLLGLYSLLLTLILATVEQSRSAGAKFDGVVTDKQLQVVLDTGLLRVCLWAILPTGTFLLSAFFIGEFGPSFLSAMAPAAVLFALGIASAVRANKLY